MAGVVIEMIGVLNVDRAPLLSKPPALRRTFPIGLTRSITAVKLRLATGHSEMELKCVPK